MFIWLLNPANRLSLAHFIPLLEIAELIDSNEEVTALIADLHSKILGERSCFEKEKHVYFRDVLNLMMEAIGKSPENLTTKSQSDLKVDFHYMLDFYQIAGSTPVDEADTAGKRVTKQTKHPLLGSLVYPILRALDEKRNGASGLIIQETDSDIAAFIDSASKRVNHNPGRRIFYATLPGLSAGKLPVMQEGDDQIDVLDGPKQVKKKISKAFCEPGNVGENGVLPIVRQIIFPICGHFNISRPEEYGGDINYSNVESVDKDFAEQKLHPGDLKKGVETHINNLLAKIQQYYQANKHLQDAVTTAFPIKKDKKPAPIVPIRNNISLKNLSIDKEISPLSLDEKMNLISRGLQEVLQRDKLESILKERNVRIYWGTATTGRPHVAYFVPMAKIADFLRAGCEVTILLADLHGYLDSQKAPWNLLDYRTEYYECIIRSMLKSIGVPIEKLRFVRGTEFEMEQEFSEDLFRLISQTTLHDAKKAGAEVVKQMSDPLIGSLLYPLLQTLDEEYLDCDAQFGGVDQRKIFTYAEKYLPQIGYTKRIHLMNPMVPGLTGGKMSSSEIQSKIDLLDDAETVRKKLNSAPCDTSNISENGILAFIQHVILPLFGAFSTTDRKFVQFEEIIQAIEAQTLSVEDLRNTTADCINRLLEPIRKEFELESLKLLDGNAYPSN